MMDHSRQIETDVIMKFKNILIFISTIFLFIFYPLSAFAFSDGLFIRTGGAKANVCSGFIIEVCGFKKIDRFPVRFKSVNDYNGKNGLCWVKDLRGMGYVTHKGKKIEKEIEYIVFPCKKVQ